jgi:WD40 repeat protein
VGGDDGVVRLYDTISGVLLRRYGGTGAGVRSLAFAPDAATFAVGYSDGTLVLRETNSNDVIRPFVGHVGAVNAVAFSADGTQMLAGDDSGSAILWNAADATQALQLDHAGSPVTSVAFSPVDPQRVLTGSADATARLWSTVNGNQLQEFAPVFSNGVLISGHSDAVTSVAFAPAGTVIATGSADKKVKLWDVALGSETATLSGHTDAVRAVAFAPDGKALLSGSDDRTALIWDLATGKAAPALKPCASPITAVAYAPDGSPLLLGVAAKNDVPLDTNRAPGTISI